MADWPIAERHVCALLMAIGGVLLATRMRSRAARLAWGALLAAGLANAVVLSAFPQNLVNINVVHHFLGAKYPFPYTSCYRVIHAALERPQVAMHDLEHPPAFLREDPRDQRAYYIDRIRDAGAELDPLVALDDLRLQAQETGALRGEAERILRENLPAGRIEEFRVDVRRALVDEDAERNQRTEGSDIAGDYGFNGSPLYTLARQADPTLHRPFGRGTAWLNLAWQVAAALALAWIVGSALGLELEGRLATAALLFASWDFVGWSLPGLIFAGLWLPVGLFLLFARRGRAFAAGVALAWAGLVKLFPFVLLLPLLAGIAPGAARRAGPATRSGSLRLLAACVVATLALGLVATLGGRSWGDFLHKISGQFESSAFLLNSVSLSQGMLALGIHRSPLQWILALAALATIATVFLRRGEDWRESLPRRSLVLLGATGWLVHTWFNYYAIAPLLLLPLVAARHRAGAAAAALVTAVAFALPEFDDPHLLETRGLHALKLAPYLLVPAWLVFLELDFTTLGGRVRRFAVAAVALGVAATAGEALRWRTIRERDRAGEAALDRGDGAAAIEHYRGVLALDPGNAMARMNEAIALAGIGWSREAAASFARAAELDPDSAVARQNHGRWLAQEGDLDAASAELEAARALTPWDENVLLDLATVRLQQGRTAEARTLLTRARELRPENEAVAGLLRDVTGR